MNGGAALLPFPLFRNRRTKLWPNHSFERTCPGVPGHAAQVKTLDRDKMLPLPSVESVVAKVKALGVAIPAGPVRVDGYGDSESLSEELLALIRSGKKRAGTGLFLAYEVEGMPLPNTGDIEIVIDHRLEPALVTRITGVEIVSYENVSAEYAAIEGEGDGSLEFWRKAHWAFFSRECQRLGREPSEAMLVVCSVFEVLSVLPPKSAV